MRYSLLLGIVCSLAVSPAVRLNAQSTNTIHGPLVGFVVDSASQVRPVVGIPGAAWLGGALPIDADIQIAAISPRQDFLLGIRTSNGQAVLVRDPLGSVAIAGLPVAAGGSRMLLSPSGSAALVVTGDASEGQVVTGLPDAPVMAWKAGFSGFANGLAGLALSDDGAVLLAATPAGDHVALQAITSNGSVPLAATAAGLGGLSFAPHGHDALLADAPSNQVSLIADVTNAAAMTPVAMATDGIAGPVAVAESEDGQRVITAMAVGVLITDRASGGSTAIPCSCSPANLTRLAANIYQITDASAGLFWILDAGINPRIVAVPPAVMMTAGGGQ